MSRNTSAEAQSGGFANPRSQRSPRPGSACPATAAVAHPSPTSRQPPEQSALPWVTLSAVKVAFKMASSAQDIFTHSIKNHWLPVNGAAWLVPAQRSTTHPAVQDPRLATSPTGHLGHEPDVLFDSPVPRPLPSTSAELALQPTVATPRRFR